MITKAIVATLVAISGAAAVPSLIDQLGPIFSETTQDTSLRVIERSAALLIALGEDPETALLISVQDLPTSKEESFEVSGLTVTTRSDWSCRILTIVPDDEGPVTDC
jgi:hypothetical protein